MDRLATSKVRYTGISTYIPYDISSITQSNISKVFKLDEQYCEVDEVLKVCVDSNIINSRLVKTAQGTSLEGQYLTGWKYISEGVFNIRIDYCGNNPESSIYTYKNQIPFNCSISLAEDTNYNWKIVESIFIEDIFSQVIDSREILISINYIFAAENC